MKKTLEKHTISFTNAWNGLIWAFQTQPNYRFHFLFSAISIIASIVLSVSYGEFLIVCVLICLGLCIETINTAIEKTSDAITREWKEEIRIAKDVGAGAMLMFAIGATTIAGIIFLPKLYGYIL